MKKLIFTALALFTVNCSLLTLFSCAPKARMVGVEEFLAAMAADSLELHSVMVSRHGEILAVEYLGGASATEPHVLNSVSKSFTATAVGFAVSEGLFGLDDTVASFFPEQMPAEPSENLTKMTVRNLLTMATGQAQEPSRAGEDWVADFLAAPVDEAPGTAFRYNSMATFMLSAIVQKTSGQKVNDYLETRLWEPLGIVDHRWEESPAGINTGGWGLYLRTEDLMKFGQLFLANGVWNGARVLPEGWVEQASARQIASGPAGNESMQNPDSDWTQGYGFQMWRCRHNAYRADGARGQFIVVLPEQDAVIVMTADIGDMQAELNHAWTYLLPQL